MDTHPPAHLAARPRSSGDPLRVATVLAAGSLVAGFVVLVAYCVAESAASGLSLVDAYWSGRLPWMGIAEGLIVSGATATIAAGGLAILVNGGWWRRAALVPLAALAALWWFAAILGIGISYAPCFDCGPPPVDPWAYAYSAPLWALGFLIVPSLVVATLALAPYKASVSRA